MRGLATIRAQLLTLARGDVDWAAHLLITKVAVEGPIRLSALADLVQSDPSTVSRQVAALVKEGYLERRADPVDGRASLLVVTALGEQLHAEHRRVRSEHYQRMLAGWGDDECQEFAQLMSRFADAIGTVQPDWMRPAPLGPRYLVDARESRLG
jgi:DNA-binding MarR family transcriptional regulator